MYQIKKFVTSFFKVYPNRHLYLHTFLRKTPWKLYDPFITFRLQMWTINYMHISKSFSVCLWNIFENITGMPLRGHLLAARIICIKNLFKPIKVINRTNSRTIWTPTYEDIGHIAKKTSNPPPKKKKSPCALKWQKTRFSRWLLSGRWKTCFLSF